MNKLRELAYRIDPVLWVREVLGVEPAAWQAEFLRAPRGASILALTARQVGKTTAAAGRLRISCSSRRAGCAWSPARRSARAPKPCGGCARSLIKVGAELKVNNVYGLELKNGSRVMALPGSDDSIRGLTVDGWIVADEAARLDNDLISALRPMRARRPHARFAMLSTAWSRTDPFWTAWADDDPSWMRLKATADVPGLYTPELSRTGTAGAGGSTISSREYLGIPGGGGGEPVQLGSVRARHPDSHAAGAGRPAFAPPANSPCLAQPVPPSSDQRSLSMKYHPDDVTSWPIFKPTDHCP